jgi:isopentenyl diphosphate isomerase/L-lactate dehydrogenase-like FMN-dependent dehydrogenase
MAKENTSLPVFVSSIVPEDLAMAVKAGADAIEVGNFDALYKKGMRMSAIEIIDIVNETVKLVSDIFICVTVPGHIDTGEQIALAKALEEMNIDLIQTEGAATVESANSGARGLLETAGVSIANTIELTRNVEIPVMTASGLTPATVPLAFAAGASAVGVGSCINKLNSPIEMLAAAASVVEAIQQKSVQHVSF